MGLFLDSGFYLALINPQDRFYDRAGLLMNQIKSGKFGRIYTSVFVMSETATLVGVRTHNNPKILKGLYSLFIGENKIAVYYRSSKIIEEKAWHLYLKINMNPQKKTVSFVDCTNIIFCQKYQLENILSFDSHFDGWINRIK